MKFDLNENYVEKTMSFDQLSRIWDRQQRIIARHLPTKAQRLKKTLTLKEKYQKYIQLGYPLVYKKVAIQYENSMGLLLKADGSTIWNATLEDYLDELKRAYNYVPEWAVA